MCKSEPWRGLKCRNSEAERKGQLQGILGSSRQCVEKNVQAKKQNVSTLLRGDPIWSISCALRATHWRTLAIRMTTKNYHERTKTSGNCYGWKEVTPLIFEPGKLDDPREKPR